MSSNIHTHSQDQQYNIGLWGPPGSGKTWFIYSFGRKLKDYQNDPDFYFELFQGDQRTDNLNEDFPDMSSNGMPLDIMPSDATKIEATKELEDQVWVFRRRGKKDTYRHVISSHSHAINVHDDAGLQTIKLASNQTVVNLATSDFLVLMLDPTKLSTFRGAKLDEEHQGEHIAIYEPHQYAEIVRNLFQALLANPRPKRYVAVCVTKIDQLSVKQRDPWQLVQMLFEKDLYDVLKTYEKNERFELQTFAVSAMGFYNEGTTTRPNFDNLTGKLAKPGDWKPYNVESPLFWLFDSVERQILENKKNGLLEQLLFKPERKKLYISYPIRHK